MSTQDPDSVYSWVGPALKEDAKKVYYPGLLMQTKAAGRSKKDRTHLIKVGYKVLIHSETNVPHIGEVNTFYTEKSSGRMRFSLKWFYRREDAKRLYSFSYSPDAKEIFYSSHIDHNDITCIKGPCYVAFLGAEQQPIVPTWGIHLNRSFFCRSCLVFDGAVVSVKDIDKSKVQSEYKEVFPAFPRQFQFMLRAHTAFWSSILQSVGDVDAWDAKALASVEPVQKTIAEAQRAAPTVTLDPNHDSENDDDDVGEQGDIAEDPEEDLMSVGEDDDDDAVEDNENEDDDQSFSSFSSSDLQSVSEDDRDPQRKRRRKGSRDLPSEGAKSMTDATAVATKTSQDMSRNFESNNSESSLDDAISPVNIASDDDIQRKKRIKLDRKYDEDDDVLDLTMDSTSDGANDLSIDEDEEIHKAGREVNAFLSPSRQQQFRQNKRTTPESNNENNDNSQGGSASSHPLRSSSLSSSAKETAIFSPRLHQQQARQHHQQLINHLSSSEDFNYFDEISPPPSLPRPRQGTIATRATASTATVNKQWSPAHSSSQKQALTPGDPRARDEGEEDDDRTYRGVDYIPPCIALRPGPVLPQMISSSVTDTTRSTSDTSSDNTTGNGYDNRAGQQRNTLAQQSPLQSQPPLEVFTITNETKRLLEADRVWRGVDFTPLVYDLICHISLYPWRLRALLYYQHVQQQQQQLSSSHVDLGNNGNSVNMPTVTNTSTDATDSRTRIGMKAKSFVFDLHQRPIVDGTLMFSTLDVHETFLYFHHLSENEGPFNSEVFIEYVVQGLAFWSEAEQKSLYRHCHRNAYSSSGGGSSGGDFVGLDMRRMKKLLPHRSTRSILDFWQRFVGSGRYLHEVLKYGHEMRSDLQSVSSSGSSAHNRTTNSTNINKKPSNSTPTTSPKPGKKGKNNNNNNNNKKKKASAEDLRGPPRFPASDPRIRFRLRDHTTDTNSFSGGNDRQDNRSHSSDERDDYNDNISSEDREEEHMTYDMYRQGETHKVIVVSVRAEHLRASAYWTEDAPAGEDAHYVAHHHPTEKAGKYPTSHTHNDATTTNGANNHTSAAIHTTTSAGSASSNNATSTAATTTVNSSRQPLPHTNSVASSSATNNATHKTDHDRNATNFTTKDNANTKITLTATTSSSNTLQLTREELRNHREALSRNFLASFARQVDAIAFHQLCAALLLFDQKVLTAADLLVRFTHLLHEALLREHEAQDMKHLLQRLEDPTEARAISLQIHRVKRALFQEFQALLRDSQSLTQFVVPAFLRDPVV